MDEKITKPAPKITHVPLQYGERFVCSCGDWNCASLD